MRGEIEIIDGWDDENRFGVMVWDRHRDSGYLARTFPDRQRAIDFAEGMVEASNLTLCTADVVPLHGGAA
ncbi:hypothetical protein [Litorisediminicola beolgyonensis]|uniref:Uncharacterized protein n=1 Tax=Litorisediminicola beolgyonensis TaxID=1173614 RepID=A0ABW3ZEC2_9RHOB